MPLKIRCRFGRLRGAAIVACAAALAAGGSAGGQTPADYPQRAVRLIVPYGPGGVGDLTMRLLADKLAERLRHPVIIENRPGAGGIAAMSEVLRAPADGYTLCEMGNGQAISMSLFGNLSYHALKDFIQISVAASFPVLLAVPDGSPYKSLSELVQAAGRAPGKLNLGAINPGSTQNLSAHLFQQLTGARYTIIAYRTTPDLVTALLRGEVDLAFDYYAGLQSAIGPGKVRIIATSGERRDPLLPEVPTARESGLASYVVSSWNGVAARAGVPDEVVKILNAAINQGLASPDVREKARALGMEAQGSTPREMRDRMAEDIDRWRGVIEKAGIPRQ